MFFHTSTIKLKHQVRIVPYIEILSWWLVILATIVVAQSDSPNPPLDCVLGPQGVNSSSAQLFNDDKDLLYVQPNQEVLKRLVELENNNKQDESFWGDSRTRRAVESASTDIAGDNELQPAPLNAEHFFAEPTQSIEQLKGPIDAARAEDLIRRLLVGESSPQILVNTTSNEDDAAKGGDNLKASETASKGTTMVLVASKSGKFNQIVPLEDLIVTQAPEFIHPTDSSQKTDSSQSSDVQLDQHQPDVTTTTNQEENRQPSLAEIIAAGTAVGLQMSDLARAGSNIIQDGLASRDGSERDESRNIDRDASRNIDRDESRNIDQSTREPPLETAMEHEMPEHAPESIESLMGSSEQEDLVEPVEPVEENDPSSSNVVHDGEDKNTQRRPRPQNIHRRHHHIKQKQRPRPRPRQKPEAEDETDEVETIDEQSYDGPLENDKDTARPRAPAMLPQRNSGRDLKTAAGHYYGKKKKKKVVKKKKIIKIKKKKKVKKYKVKKYKKVKVYKKKKKVKKYHHHGGHGHGYGHGHGHGHGHDHGKYYMYAKVPKKKSWEFGYKRGNKKHWIERHEKGHKNKFKTKVKWYDKKSKGKGIHIWDYNHFDKKKYHG